MFLRYDQGRKGNRHACRRVSRDSKGGGNTKKEKHFYILAGALMMLILVSAVAMFYRNVQADIAEPDVSSDQARQIALSDAGVDPFEVTFTKTKLDSEDGIPVYEIDFYTNERDYEYEINARTGAVREREVTVLKEVVMENTEKPAAEEPESSRSTGADALIGVENAQKAALTEAGLTAGDVEFYSTSLDTDDGRTLYEVKFLCGNQEYEFEIDAYSGKVLKEQIRSWVNEDQESTEVQDGDPAAEASSAERVYSDDDDEGDDDDRYDDRDDDEDDRDDDDRDDDEDDHDDDEDDHDDDDHDDDDDDHDDDDDDEDDD